MKESFLRLMTLIGTTMFFMFCVLSVIAVTITGYSCVTGIILFFSDLLINTTLFTWNNALFGGIVLSVFSWLITKGV